MKTKTNTIRPKEINILGTKYKIFYDSERCDPKMEHADGYVERFLKEIHINSDLYDKEYQKNPAIAGGLERHILDVFRHEIIHAFIYESGLWENSDWATNEEMTDWFAKQFPKLSKCFKQIGVEE